jgi:hypothetical protein
VDNAALVTGAKWIGAVIVVLAVSAILYFGAVLSIYILGWILELIGIIFE